MLNNLKNKNLLKEKCLINGKWIDSKNNSSIKIINPATNEIIANIPKLTIEECLDAINTSVIAQKIWKNENNYTKSKFIRKLYDLIMQNIDDLSLILTLEQGKSLAEAKGEILYGASYFEWYAEEAKRIYEEMIPPLANDQKILILKEPVGVCAAITPWNFP